MTIECSYCYMCVELHYFGKNDTPRNFLLYSKAGIVKTCVAGIYACTCNVIKTVVGLELMSYVYLCAMFVSSVCSN